MHYFRSTIICIVITYITGLFTIWMFFPVWWASIPQWMYRPHSLFTKQEQDDLDQVINRMEEIYKNLLAKRIVLESGGYDLTEFDQVIFMMRERIDESIKTRDALKLDKLQQEAEQHLAVFDDLLSQYMDVPKEKSTQEMIDEAVQGLMLEFQTAASKYADRIYETEQEIQQLILERSTQNIQLANLRNTVGDRQDKIDELTLVIDGLISERDELLNRIKTQEHNENEINGIISRLEGTVWEGTRVKSNERYMVIVRLDRYDIHREMFLGFIYHLFTRHHAGVAFEVPLDHIRENRLEFTIFCCSACGDVLHRFEINDNMMVGRIANRNTQLTMVPLDFSDYSYGLSSLDIESRRFDRHLVHGSVYSSDLDFFGVMIHSSLGVGYLSGEPAIIVVDKDKSYKVFTADMLDELVNPRFKNQYFNAVMNSMQRNFHCR